MRVGSRFYVNNLFRFYIYGWIPGDAGGNTRAASAPEADTTSAGIS